MVSGTGLDRVQPAFLSVPGPDLAVARVGERVRLGGHDVPEAVVQRRFGAGSRDFFALYRDIADTWQVFDNSAVAGPRLVASGRAGQPAHVHDADAWTNLLERQA